MEILEISPETGGKTLARFDAQLSPDVRMFGLKLVKTPRGYRVYPPHCNTHSHATFAPAFAEKLARAALAALTGESDASSVSA